MSIYTKKVMAILLTLLLVFGSGSGTFAIPDPFDSPYLVHGNDSGATTKFYYADTGDVFLDVSGYSYLKIEDKDFNNPPKFVAPGLWISWSVSGATMNWTSNFPIHYVFVKSGNLSSSGPIELYTDQNTGNQYGYLYEYTGGEKSGMTSTSPRAVSHFTFIFRLPEVVEYEVSVKKVVSGDKDDSDPTFQFQLVDDLTDITVATASVKAGETATFTPKVPEGDYYIREVNPPSGYTPQSNIQVPASEVVQNPTYEFTNRFDKDLFTVSVTKTMSGIKPNPPVPFTFELIKVTEGEPDVWELVDTVIIYNEGTESFDPVEEGTYFVREVDPGINYEVTGDSGEFYIGPNNKTVNKTFNNHHLTYEIDVSKYTFYDDIYDPNEYMNGEQQVFALSIEGEPEFTFELWNIDDPENPIFIDSLTLPPFGSGTFIPVEAGKYLVKEVDVPDHFRQVTVGEDDELIKEIELGGEGWEGALFRFYNQRLYDIIVNKEITGGGPNSTFTFKLFDAETDEEIDEVMIQGSGSATFKPVPSGQYYVREMTPPSGYSLVGENDLAAEVNSEQHEDEVFFTNRYVTTEPTTEVTTEPTTEATTEPTTGVTTEATTEATTESTEEITTEPVPLNLDIIYDEPETEELIVEEEVPLGDALPQTGQLPAGLFYGFGSLLSAAGVYIRRRR